MKYSLFIVIGVVMCSKSWGKAEPFPALSEHTSPLVVLCYHQFGNQDKVKGRKNPYKISSADFLWQMEYIKNHGITPVTMQQVENYFLKGKALPPHPVLLTFDDGYRSIYLKAYPILKRLHFPGVLFIYSDFIRYQGPLCLKYSDIRTMMKNGLVVESHSKSHPNFEIARRKLGSVNYPKFVTEQVEEPIHFIFKHFGVIPKVFAYPYGIYDPVILSALQKAGYKLGFTVNYGNNDRSVPLLMLKRNMVTTWVSKQDFERYFKMRVLHLADCFPMDGQAIYTQEPTICMKIINPIQASSLKLLSNTRSIPFQYDSITGILTCVISRPMWYGGHQLTVFARNNQNQKLEYSWYFQIVHPAKTVPQNLRSNE